MVEFKGYTLRFPFHLAPGQEFSKLDKPYESECLGLNLRLGSQSGLYYFSVGDFQDEDAGTGFIPKLWAGLMWALLHQGVSPIAKLSSQTIKYAEDPFVAGDNISRSIGLKTSKLDGILDGASPAVYKSDKIVKVMTSQNVTATQAFAPDRTIAFIKEALSLPRPEAVLHNYRLNKKALQLKDTMWYPEHTWEVYVTFSTVSEGFHGVKGDSVDSARDRRLRLVGRRIFQGT